MTTGKQGQFYIQVAISRSKNPVNTKITHFEVKTILLKFAILSDNTTRNVSERAITSPLQAPESQSIKIEQNLKLRTQSFMMDQRDFHFTTRRHCIKGK